MKKSLNPGPAFWYLGLSLTLLGSIFLIANYTSDMEKMVLVGLYTMFISSIERQDERSKALKVSSTHIALLAAYVIKLVIAALSGYEVISFRLTEINQFLILVFVLALIIYYWRLYITIGKA